MYHPYLDGTIDLAFLHKIPPCDLFLAIVAAGDVLREIQSDYTQCDALGLGSRIILLDDFEVDIRSLQKPVFVRRNPQLRSLLVVPCDFVFFDRRFMSLAPMLGRRGMR